MICASVDPALGGTEACSPSTAGPLLLSTPKGADHAGKAAEEGALVGVTADTSSGLRTLVLSGAAEGEEGAAVLDLTAEVRDDTRGMRARVSLVSRKTLRRGLV